jgi:Histidine phosphatase superfamily (branch 1)
VKKLLSCVLFSCICLTSSSPTLSQTTVQNSLVTIFVVRHAESRSLEADPERALTPLGRERATQLTTTLKSVRFTHLFATHTARTRETVKEIAAIHKLAINQLPPPGAIIKGKLVTDDTPRSVAVEPISKSLLALPSGSIALVALNSENLFAVLNKLGVPIDPAGEECVLGSACVPCITGECFPRNDFDRVWLLIRDPRKNELSIFLEFRYGAGSKLAN